MRLWLIYDRDNIPRNQFFIERWLLAGREKGVEPEVVAREEITFGIRDSRLFLDASSRPRLPDCAVIRANDPLLSAHLEGMGIPVFNNAALARVCNDKRLTHQMAAGLFPMMDTVFLHPRADRCPFPYPAVVKGVHGNGGRQVYLAENDQNFRRALDSLAPDEALVQPLCDTPGRDVRVYMLGQEVVKSMMRMSDGNFRSNIGLGASARPYDPGPEALDLARRFSGTLDAGLIGVDFVFHQGRLVFNEIEDAVGTRMLYALNERDIVRDYLSFILGKLG